LIRLLYRLVIHKLKSTGVSPKYYMRCGHISGECKESADGLPVCSGCKGESEILARDLSESFGDKLGFEVGDPEILVVLDMKDPCITNGLPPWWKMVDFFVDAFCLQPLEFFIHCCKPFSPIN
jgi:hypothetical protein